MAQNIGVRHLKLRALIHLIRSIPCFHLSGEAASLKDTKAKIIPNTGMVFLAAATCTPFLIFRCSVVITGPSGMDPVIHDHIDYVWNKCETISIRSKLQVATINIAILDFPLIPTILVVWIVIFPIKLTKSRCIRTMWWDRDSNFNDKTITPS